MKENAMWPKSMHPSVIQAIQEIDAAVFNGDTFEDPEARVELKAYLERWTRQLAEIADEQW